MLSSTKLEGTSPGRGQGDVSWGNYVTLINIVALHSIFFCFVQTEIFQEPVSQDFEATYKKDIFFPIHLGEIREVSI